MKPFKTDGCCRLSACQPQKPIWFLYNNKVIELLNPIFTQYPQYKGLPRYAPRAAYLGNLYSHWTNPEGITVIKACEDQRKCCRSVPHSKNSQAKAMAASRTTESTQEQPWSSCNQEKKTALKHKEGCLEPPSSLMSFPCEIKHMGWLRIWCSTTHLQTFQSEEREGAIGTSCFW